MDQSEQDEHDHLPQLSKENRQHKNNKGLISYEYKTRMFYDGLDSRDFNRRHIKRTNIYFNNNHLRGLRKWLKNTTHHHRT